MVKRKCCLKYKKKGKCCKGCPIVSLEDIFKKKEKKVKKKNKKKKKDKKKRKND